MGCVTEGGCTAKVVRMSSIFYPDLCEVEKEDRSIEGQIEKAYCQITGAICEDITTV